MRIKPARWHGYTGRVLSIDLTSGAIVAGDLDSAAFPDFIGGAGTAGTILYDKFAPGSGPLGERTPFILMTGPLTGSPFPGCVNFSVVTRSPLNGFFVCTNANGRFGRCLKLAGYDGLVLEGRSDKLVYLYVDHARAQLLDAAELAGKDVYEATSSLQSIHGNDVSVGAIGIAGESKVRFSGVLFDREHSASKGGPGAVLGAKNVKALVVKAPRATMPVYDQQKVKQVMARWQEVDDKSGLGLHVSKQGMRGLFDQLYERGIIPIKNLTSSDFAAADRFSFEAFAAPFEIRRNACPGCSFNHFNRFIYEGEDLKEPSFDTVTGYGPNIGIDDPVKVVRLLTLTDRLGMETQEASWILSFLMESYELGTVKAGDLDGLELRWGSFEAAAALLRKIAAREGCGALFADGIYQAALSLGGDSLDRAVWVKRGGVPQMMDNRNDWPFAFAEVVTNRSGLELASNVRNRMMDGDELGIDYPTGPDIAGDARIIPAHHALAMPRWQIADMVGLCVIHSVYGYLPIISDALEAVTGIRFEPHALIKAGTRLANLQRAYNVRYGHSPQHDSISARFLSAPERGPNAGRAMRQHLPEMLQSYYRQMGWDEAGVPRADTLRALGLDDVARDLERERLLS